ncbi:Carbohydrate esterase family 4 protein [Halorhabdus tiamatea SARL4B]|uniref:Carbohydrate esterase family 4 protein n=1 Tax=Halorhabdus tiamatea SARL4B TaxID=1033806 RepID=F7PG17_9EURY|nr:polysaccharide deacetylase family protein [Halorhabdus tiamatea]ERJ07261.1 Carbohydrate esterase family 4 protein [Halorhabdus tiamatea SARL4B]CCQ34171.1 polysaccharide deacetlyase [Halorhabdus tiamatea SARL4B]
MTDARLALVFDDGYRSDFDMLRPALAELDAPMTLAIVPGWLGGDDHVTPEELRTLAEDGHEILSHGRRHRYLGTHRVTADVSAGDRRVTLDDHVFPEDDHGVYVGDDYEITDGEESETVTLAEKAGTDDEPIMAFETALSAEYAAGEAVVRPAMDTIEDEIVGVREEFDELGFDPTGFVFPYDATDPRAWAVASEEYDTIANAAVRSLPNPPGTLPTNWRRYYLQTDHLTRPEIESYLDTLAEQGGVGILAGHSDWASVPEERVTWTVEAARERGIDVTTLREAAERVE